MKFYHTSGKPSVFFKYCRVCKKTEIDPSKIHGYFNDKGEFVYDNLHIKCLKKDKPSNRSNFKRKCKHCGELERNPDKLVHLKCDRLQIGYSILSLHKKCSSAFYKERNKKQAEKQISNFGRICKFCLKTEHNEGELYKTKNGVIYSYHIKCYEDYKIDKELKLKQERAKKERKRKKKNMLENFIDTPERKVCTKCGEEKHISEYYQRRDLSFYPHCKKCQSIINKKWKENNIDSVKKYHKQYNIVYQKDNKDKLSKYRRERYHKNKTNDKTRISKKKN